MSRYGTLDLSDFTDLELRLYALIKGRVASMFELQEYYTLSEALKLYALVCFDNDLQRQKMEELNAGGRSR